MITKKQIFTHFKKNCNPLSPIIKQQEYINSKYIEISLQEKDHYTPKNIFYISIYRMTGARRENDKTFLLSTLITDEFTKNYTFDKYEKAMYEFNKIIKNF